MELLTTNEAAKILRVTPIRVRQLIREGKIAAKQIGRDYVIEESSLETVKTYGKAGRPLKDAENGNQRNDASKTPKSFAEVAAKYIGSYLAAMNGADAIIFAGGIGENAPVVRARSSARSPPRWPGSPSPPPVGRSTPARGSTAPTG